MEKALDRIAWVIVALVILGVAGLLAGLVYLVLQVTGLALSIFGLIVGLALVDWAFNRVTYKERK